MATRIGYEDSPIVSLLKAPLGASDAEVDLTIQRWTTPAMFAGSSVVYLAGILVLFLWMKRVKAPMRLHRAMQVYNLAQVVFNALMTIEMAPSFVGKYPNIFGLSTPFSQRMRILVFWHYSSKFLDFLDTVFIVLRKKDAQLSFLHIYHHATIGAIWGFLLYIGYGNGTAGFGAFINSFIHFVMYGHYLIQSFGIRNPFKKWITTMQLIQFGLCVVHVPLVLIYDKVYDRRWLCYLQFGYHVTMILLFSSFFVKEYSSKKKARLD